MDCGYSISELSSKEKREWLSLWRNLPFPLRLEVSPPPPFLVSCIISSFIETLLRNTHCIRHLKGTPSTKFALICVLKFRAHLSLKTLGGVRKAKKIRQQKKNVWFLTFSWLLLNFQRLYEIVWSYKAISTKKPKSKVFWLSIQIRPSSFIEWGGTWLAFLCHLTLLNEWMEWTIKSQTEVGNPVGFLRWFAIACLFSATLDFSSNPG